MMTGIIKIKSYPKINLALDILGKDPSGYHLIQTVLHEVKDGPVDELTIEECAENIIEIKCDNPAVPINEENTVYQAAMLLKKATGIKKGTRIFIKKRIPIKSGLGGGSSNAVAALKGLGQLWNIPVPCTLFPVASLGMDCEFFVRGGTAFSEHFGEKITQLPPLPDSVKIRIIETGVEVSSGSAYLAVDLSKCGKNKTQTQELIKGIYQGSDEKILKNIHNDFEELIFKKYPELGARHLLLAGSGGALVKLEK